MNPEPPTEPTTAEHIPSGTAAGGLQDQVDGLAATVTALALQLGELLGAELGAADPQAGEPVEGDTTKKAPAQVAWWWPGLDGKAAAAAWERLGAWVQHALLARHPHYGKGLLPCWRRHAAIVDDLSALRAIWHAAYTGPAPDPGAAADYLARSLPDTMTRVAAAFKRSGCSTAAGIDHHKDNDEKSQRTQWAQPEVDAFLAARRGSAPGVSPAKM